MYSILVPRIMSRSVLLAELLLSRSDLYFENFSEANEIFLEFLIFLTILLIPAPVFL